MTGQDMADMAFTIGTGLNAISQPEHLRWVPCEECDGQGHTFVIVGEKMCAGQGGPYEPVVVECRCTCDDGYIQVDECDSRWDEGTYAHPMEDVR